MTKPLLRVLRGERLDPPPLWLMRQAGRYLPEYRATRASAGGFLELCLTPALAAEVTLQPLQRFGFDAAILFSDILLLPWAMGQNLTYGEGEGPRLAPVRDAAGLAALRLERVAERTAPVREAVRLIAAATGDAALIGFAGAPFTVACYMVDGRGGDFLETRTLAWRDPGFFADLIALLTEGTIATLAGQIEAGAEAVMLFDTWAGLLPPSLFAAHVTAPAQRITAALHARFPGVPVIGFPRLAGASLAAYARATGVQAVGMDTQTDPATLPADLVVQGNLDPLALLAGGAALEREVGAVRAATAARPHIFNLGHGVLKETPPEHVARLVELVRRR
ncbi:MAG: uroporphyrinogen decarboxylase [Rhodospirillales bacterium]|nr:uroporphyrinogen decarboxylase [Rhodospirillales bacterium]